jgi:hypothetical protein
VFDSVMIDDPTRANVRMCIDHGHRAVGNCRDGWQNQTAIRLDFGPIDYVKYATLPHRLTRNGN